MIRIAFTEEQLEQLHHGRFHHPHPRVQLKMEALLLKSQNLPHRQICHLLHISENMLRAYFRDFLAGGVEKLKELNFFKPESDLAEHRETLEAYFQNHPPATVKEAGAKIEELTGIRRGLSQVRHFLKSIGLRRLKVGFVPAKADLEEQERFRKRRTGTAFGGGPNRAPRVVLRGRPERVRVAAEGCGVGAGRAGDAGLGERPLPEVPAGATVGRRSTRKNSIRC